MIHLENGSYALERSEVAIQENYGLFEDMGGYFSFIIMTGFDVDKYFHIQTKDIDGCWVNFYIDYAPELNKWSLEYDIDSNDDDTHLENFVPENETDLPMLIDLALEAMWRDMQTCKTKDGCLDEDYFIWSKDTSLQTVFEWFNRYYSKSVFEMPFNAFSKKTN